MLSARIKHHFFRLIHHNSIRQGALFVLLSLITAALTIVFISWQYLAILKEQDKNFIDNRLLGYWLQYRITNEEDFIPLLKEEFNNIPSDRASFLRIADEENRTIYLAMPAEWMRFPLDLLKSETPLGRQTLILKSPDFNYHLMAGEIILTNGYRIQTGISTENRVFLLTAVKHQLFPLILVILGISTGAAILLSVKALKPIRDLENHINEITVSQEFTRRMELRGTGDSFDSLSGHFNLLLQKVEDTINNLKQTLDNTAHDLRTPLTRIRSAAERAVISGNDEEKDEALMLCLEETGNLASLIDTLMDLSEAEQGLMKLKKEEFSLNAALLNISEIYSFPAEEKGISLICSLDNEHTLRADPQRFQQAVGNLLNNAVKYCKSGDQISIEVDIIMPYLVIRVKDTGPGISEEESKQIWDRLYRGEKSRTEKGSGLGLSLVKAVMLAHRGKADWSENKPSGSVFSLYFPI